MINTNHTIKDHKYLQSLANQTKSLKSDKASIYKNIEAQQHKKDHIVIHIVSIFRKIATSFKYDYIEIKNNFLEESKNAKNQKKCANFIYSLNRLMTLHKLYNNDEKPISEWKLSGEENRILKEITGNSKKSFIFKTAISWDLYKKMYQKVNDQLNSNTDKLVKYLAAYTHLSEEEIRKKNITELRKIATDAEIKGNLLLNEKKAFYNKMKKLSFDISTITSLVDRIIDIYDEVSERNSSNNKSA